jgi:hypothetical protein
MSLKDSFTNQSNTKNSAKDSMFSKDPMFSKERMFSKESMFRNPPSREDSESSYTSAENTTSFK